MRNGPRNTVRIDSILHRIFFEVPAGGKLAGDPAFVSGCLAVPTPFVGIARFSAYDHRSQPAVSHVTSSCERNRNFGAGCGFNSRRE